MIRSTTRSAHSRVRHVSQMDGEVLDSFVRRTWATWDPASLDALRVAMEARRAELNAG